jgi:hypothetical protein
MMPWGSLMLGAIAGRLGVANAVTIGGAVVIVSAGFAVFQKRHAVRAERVAAE